MYLNRNPIPTAAPNTGHAQARRRSSARNAAHAATAQQAMYGPSIVAIRPIAWKTGAARNRAAAIKPARHTRGRSAPTASRPRAASAAKAPTASAAAHEAITDTLRIAASLSPSSHVAARIASAIPGPFV